MEEKEKEQNAALSKGAQVHGWGPPWGAELDLELKDLELKDLELKRPLHHPRCRSKAHHH